MSTLITFVEPGMFTAVPAVMTTRSPGATIPVERAAAVQKLQEEKSRLEHQLGASTSLGTLAREARSLGYVRPGEHLFIVKGIRQWRQLERRSLSPHGH